jgi:hypothetical protein
VIFIYILVFTVRPFNKRRCQVLLPSKKVVLLQLKISGRPAEDRKKKHSYINNDRKIK